MSQWNLSVRLSGQGSDLSRTLRSIADDARAASRDVNAVRRDISRLRAETHRPLRLRLGVDGRHLRTEVRNAVRGASAGAGIQIPLKVNAASLRGEVRRALNSAAGQGLSVDLSLGNAMQLRRDVADAVRWAAWGHRIEIPIGLADPMQLRRDVSNAVRWASMNQTITVRVRADTSGLGDLTRTLNSGGGDSGGLGMNDAMQALILLSPAVLPVAANVAILAGQLATAGVTAGIFGAALAGQIGPLSEAAEAETKYKDAVAEHGKASKEAIEAQIAQQRILAGMPQATQEAAAALSILRSDFSGWSDDMADFTMEPLTHGMGIIGEVLPHLSPQVESFSGQLNRLVDIAGGAVSTPGFDGMMDRFARFSDQNIDALTDKVVHFLRVLSQGGGDGAIAQFMDYARENGPAVQAALSNIGDAVSTLVQGAAEAGPGMLTIVSALAKLVSSLPPEVVGLLIQLAAAIKLMQIAGSIGVALGGLAGGIGRLVTVSRTAGGGIAGLSAALATLSTGAKIGLAAGAIGALALAMHELSGNKPAVEVDALSSSLNTLVSTGKVTGALKTNLDGMSESIAMVSKTASNNKLLKLTSDFGTWIGIASGPGISDATKNVDAWDKVMANNVKNGHAKEAAAQFDLLKRSWKAAGGDMGQLKKHTDNYRSAMADAKFEADHLAESQGLFGAQAQKVAGQLAAQKSSADGLRQSLQALNDVSRKGATAMSAFEQSMDDVAEATGKYSNALKMKGGEPDLGTKEAREAEKLLSDLATNTDAATAAARENGKSWQYVNGIYKEGRAAFVKAADDMGLTRTQAEALADSYLRIPEKKALTLEMRSEDAQAGLDAVIGKIKQTPDAKSVTVKALTGDAISLLESVGFKVTELKDGRFKVTAETGTAKGGLDALKILRDGLKDKSFKVDTATENAIADLETVKAKVASTKGKTITMRAPTAEAREQLLALGFRIKNTKGKNVKITAPTGSQRAGVAQLAGAIAALRNRTVTVTTVYRIKGKPGGPPSGTYYGSTAGRSADGNLYGPARVQRFAEGGMGEQHVAQIAQPTYRMWAEPETGGEAYIPFAPSKRPRSRAIAEETVRRLGGDPQTIQWNAEGSVTDWRYDPQSGSLYSPSDAGSAGNKTRKVKTRVKGKWVTKEVEYFDIGAVEKKLKSAASATRAWNKDLEKVADRVGGDVAEALASMGKEGQKLADKMANGSTKYINQMAKALRDLQKTAKASLTDYTRQLGSANKLNKEFSDDLATLAARGYGDLAQQLAAQNDKAAQELAAAAVKDKGKASAANKAAKTANNALTSDQVEQLVSIIAAITKSTTGIHDVAASTGLGEDVIVATATKASSQIKNALGSRSSRFLADLAKAQKGLAFANGGVRPGIYSTANGAVTFAEPSTGGEAYIPLGQDKRRHAMPVLSDVAGRFGLGLRDAKAGRIVHQYFSTSQSVTSNVSGVGNAEEVARRVADGDAYQMRRLARGGVGARG